MSISILPKTGFKRVCSEPSNSPSLAPSRSYVKVQLKSDPFFEGLIDDLVNAFAKWSLQEANVRPRQIRRIIRAQSENVTRKLTDLLDGPDIVKTLSTTANVKQKNLSNLEQPKSSKIRRTDFSSPTHVREKNKQCRLSDETAISDTRLKRICTSEPTVFDSHSLFLNNFASTLLYNDSDEELDQFLKPKISAFEANRQYRTFNVLDTLQAAEQRHHTLQSKA